MPDGETVRRGIIVSCQAPPGSPLDDPAIMAAMAQAAELGGARGIRANGPANIAAIRRAVRLPIIGLLKRDDPGSPVYITPTFEAAEAVAIAGADLVAVDATLRERSDGRAAADLIRQIVGRLGLPVVADVDTLAAGLAAAEAGAALIATTLSGYTAEPVPDEPDIELVRLLASEIGRPVLAEGRYHTPGHVAAAFAAGAYAVVVGAAVTDPVALTQRFVAACPPIEADR